MLPFFKTAMRELEMLQTQWASQLNPLLVKVLLKGVQLDTTLTTGSNVINHRLGRKPVGWIIVDTNAAVAVYRTSWDDLTITLNSSANASASIYIY
jgi:hypothetical protein